MAKVCAGPLARLLATGACQRSVATWHARRDAGGRVARVLGYSQLLAVLLGLYSTPTMAPRHRTAVLFWSLAVLLATLLLSVHAQNPSHTISHFRNLPARIFFFDDTEVSAVLRFSE